MTQQTKPFDPYEGMPQAVRVGGYWFVVELMSQHDAEGNREFGHCNLIGQRIRLQPGMTPQKLANTFLHEVLHAIHWVHGLDNQSSEEDFTGLTANGLCAFWQDNGGYWDWFSRNNLYYPVTHA